MYDYAMPMVCCQSETKTSLILCFGVITFKREENFHHFFAKFFEITNQTPLVITVDRCDPQNNALKRVYPHSFINYCRIHLMRTVKKNFCSEIINCFNSMIYQEIDENTFISFVAQIVKKIDSMLFHQHFSQFEIVQLPTNLINDLQNIKVVAKLGSLIRLITDREHYFPSIINRYVLYHRDTTNVVEGGFGVIKLKDPENKSLIELINHVKYICITFNTNTKAVGELPKRVFDRGDKDVYLNQINEHCKDILINQYELMLKNQSTFSDDCISCKY